MSRESRESGEKGGGRESSGSRDIREPAERIENREEIRRETSPSPAPSAFLDHAARAQELGERGAAPCEVAAPPRWARPIMALASRGAGSPPLVAQMAPAPRGRVRPRRPRPSPLRQIILAMVAVIAATCPCHPTARTNSGPPTAYLNQRPPTASKHSGQPTARPTRICTTRDRLRRLVCRPSLHTLRNLSQSLF